MHKVANGDTLSEISRFYGISVADIVQTNGLRDAASIRKGMDLMIPGAVQKIAKIQDAPKNTVKTADLRPIPTQVPDKTPTVINTVTGMKSRYLVKYTGLSRGFAWGNCTWYVGQNKSVSWRGNANQWMRNAKAAGALTGQKPVP